MARTEVYTCDRCKKSIDRLGRNMLRRAIGEYFNSADRFFDLCNECNAALDQWFSGLPKV